MIGKILEFQIGKNFEYRVTLRNERKFNIGDIVFFTYNRFSTERLFNGEVVGVELSISDNPEYIYKVRIPGEAAVDGKFGESRIIENLECESMFLTLEEAKKSALKGAKNIYEIYLKNIEVFFSQFEK